MNPPRHYYETELNGLLRLLDDWARRGWLRELDRAFAAFLAEETPDADPLLILACALASHQLGRGHVCLTLDVTLRDPSLALSLPPEGDALSEQPVLPSAFLDGLSLPAWRQALRHPSLVDAQGRADAGTPMVLIGNRLYLRRFWRYERDVRESIDRRIAPGGAGEVDADTHACPLADAPRARLRDALDALFPVAGGASADTPTSSDASHPPGTAPPPADWQKLACALAAARRFSIITGGPGTGKTTTVVKLLAILQYQAMNAGIHVPSLRIRLAAPTGKAAARLNESIARAVHNLTLDALPDAERVRAAIPTDVTTLHRLLGSRPDSRHFRYNARKPLSLDVLVIDEASMVDLEMMAAVLAAMPEHARLVLLGDKDQLASVEAGAVLGELCRFARDGRYWPKTAAWLDAVTGETVAADLISDEGTALDQSVAMLRQSYRFTARSGIGRLADAVNRGSVPQARAVWSHGYPDIARVLLGNASRSPPRAAAGAAQMSLALPTSADAALRDLVIDGARTLFPSPGGPPERERAADGDIGPVGYRHYLSILRDRRPDAAADAADFDAWAHAVLQAHGRFQVLCALRRGAFGVDRLNQRIAGILQTEGWITDAQGWYLGRPVLVTRNDYSLGLMNGDVGITLARPHWPDPLAPPVWHLRVAFLSGDAAQSIKWVLPSRLQAIETVYAMTVHKSQGSEFTHAALVLPERMNPILTRELVYTGITRARQWFTLATADRHQAVFEAAIQRQVLRASGLLGNV